jgi:uncharacterized ferredoxin-like protein
MCQMLDVFEGDGSGNSKANDDPSGGNGAATTRPGSSQPTKQQPQPLATNTSDDSAAKLIALKAEKQALESTVKSLTKQTELLRQQQVRIILVNSKISLNCGVCVCGENRKKLRLKCTR